MLAHPDEIDEALSALLAGAVAVHAKVIPGEAEIADLLAQANAIFRTVARAMSRDGSEQRQDFLDAAGLFRAVGALRSQASGLSGLESVFDDIESHGRYLAVKSGRDYVEFLSGPPRRYDEVLSADAVLNASSGLVRLFEQWSDRGGAELDGSSSAGLPPWAAEQLNELARIEPRLGLQLKEGLRDFPLTRQRPKVHPLYRCLADNSDVLEPPPAVVIGLPSVECSPEHRAFIEAAQDAAGTMNVLVMTMDRRACGFAGSLRAKTRMFCAEDRAPQLSDAQRFSFLRDYIASTQPSSVLNCGSALLWDVFLQFGKPLSCTSRLYATLAAGDLTGADVPSGFAATHLPEALPDLEAVYLNDAAGKALIEHIFALPPSWACKIRILSPTAAADLFRDQ